MRTLRLGTRNLSPHAIRSPVALTAMKTITIAENHRVFTVPPCLIRSPATDIVNLRGEETSNWSAKSDSLYRAQKTRVAANLVPRSIDVEKHEARRSVDEGRVQVLKALFGIAKPGMEP